MAFPKSYKDREQAKFVECNNEVAVRTKICQEQPIEVTDGGGTTPLITNLSISSTNTEFSHTLQNNLKKFVLRSRDKAELKVAFTATESGTNFIPVVAGAVLTLEGLNFSGKVLYIQSPKINTVEILEIT